MRYLKNMKKVKEKETEEGLQSVKLVNPTYSKGNLSIFISLGRIINQKLKVLSVQERKISIDHNFSINLIRKSNQREDRNQ